MLDKFKIKQFVEEVIHSVRGLAAKIAKAYGKSEFWISDLLSPASETDGPVYSYLLFMQRLSEESPETEAMIDDEVRRICDELKAKGATNGASEDVDVLFSQVTKAYTDLLLAYKNRASKGVLKAQAAKLGAQNNQFLQLLDPPKPRLLEIDEKKAGMR